MFERGLDVKESLGLGEFAPMVKELRKIFEERLTGKRVDEIWSTHFSPNSAKPPRITDEIICKNIPDAGGGNVNKFIIWVHNRNEDPSWKDYIKKTIFRCKTDFHQFDCSVTAVNYYQTEKYNKKYDMPLDRKGLIIEIIYIKYKR